MNPSELSSLGYPTNIEDLIRECEGVELLETEEHRYIIHDNYNDEDRVLHINKTPDFREEYFKFFGNEIDKKRVFEFAKILPPLLFMNLNKVYFVEKDEDLMGEVDEESPNHTFFFSDNRSAIGMAVYRDSIAFVNLRQLKIMAKEEEQEDLKVLGYTDGWERIFMDAVCDTLAHELFHLTQFNPLIEEYIPDGENAVEEFCRHYSGD